MSVITQGKIVPLMCDEYQQLYLMGNDAGELFVWTAEMKEGYLGDMSLPKIMIPEDVTIFRIPIIGGGIEEVSIGNWGNGSFLFRGGYAHKAQCWCISASCEDNVIWEVC